jgi:hypothetical protein
MTKGYLVQTRQKGAENDLETVDGGEEVQERSREEEISEIIDRFVPTAEVWQIHDTIAVLNYR